jgi:hypothetical protein
LDTETERLTVRQINKTQQTKATAAAQLVLLLAVLLAVAELAPAQNLPSAESILDRYVEVTGGRAAYEKHTSEVLTGSITFPAQGLKGRITRYSAPPDREYSLVEIEAIGKIESGVYNSRAWEKSVILGPRIKDGVEKEQALREAHFNGPLEWRKLYVKVELQGVRSIDGEDCYELVLTPAKGNPEHQFFSAKTGLLRRTTMVGVTQMGDVDIVVDVSDYKKFGGILFPTRSTQKAAGQEIEIVIERIGVDEPIPASQFDPPADIGAMIRKQIAAEEGKL